MTILLVDDDITLNRLLCSQLKKEGYATASAHSWREAQQQLARIEPALIVLDTKLPDADGLDKVADLVEHCPVLVLTAFGSIDQAVAAIKNGAADYLSKPINPDTFFLAIKRILAVSSMRREYEFFKQQVAQSEPSRDLIGISAVIQDLRRTTNLLGESDATVLVLGESGVGKELVAAAIHRASPRAEEKFVAVDCSTLQENLVESELFGHEKGAFTSADRRKEGLIEIGNGGTIFLDEIGEMSLALQAKFLRVLETGQFRRVGGTKNISSNIRFIAATNRNLQQMCREGKFRDDLYYRLSAFVIEVPPLRERMDDVPILAEHFLRTRDFGKSTRKRLSPGAIAALARYNWPGNIRELRNIIERAALVSGREDDIRAIHIGRLERQPMKGEYTFSFDTPPALDEIIEVYLERLLRDGALNRSEIAKIMGISERSLYRMLHNRSEGGAEEEMHRAPGRPIRP